MTDYEAIRARYEKWAEQVCFDADGLGCGECNAGQEGYLSPADALALLAEIERYKAMVASEHELLNGIIREGETPLDAMRRVVKENEFLRDEALLRVVTESNRALKDIVGE